MLYLDPHTLSKHLDSHGDENVWRAGQWTERRLSENGATTRKAEPRMWGCQCGKGCILCLRQVSKDVWKNYQMRMFIFLGWENKDKEAVVTLYVSLFHPDLDHLTHCTGPTTTMRLVRRPHPSSASLHRTGRRTQKYSKHGASILGHYQVRIESLYVLQLHIYSV